MFAEAEGGDEEEAFAEAALGDERGEVVEPADKDSGVDVRGEVARREARDDVFGREVGEGEVHDAAGRNLAEHPVLPEPVEVARPVALPPAPPTPGDLHVAEVSLLRLGRLGEPEHAAPLLHAPLK